MRHTSPASESDADCSGSPAAEAARTLLKKRFKRVLGLLPLAAENPDGDIEHVHRLRVATRRAGAALAAFRPLMDRNSSAAKAALRRVRRAAGPARDADVLWLRLAERTGEPFVRCIAEPRLRAERDDAQRSLCRVATKHRSKRLRAALREAVALLEDPTERPIAFGDFARDSLDGVVARFQSVAREDLEGWHELHQLRIAGKRLRYTLELFESALPADEHRTATKATKALQDRLGAINDHATAQAHYQFWISSMPADSDAALVAAEIVAESARAEALAAEFHAWWVNQGERELASVIAQLG